MFEIVSAQADELDMAAYFRGLMTKEFGKDWDSNFPGWRERFIEYFAAKINSEQGQIFYAQVNGEIVGVAAISLVDDYHAAVRNVRSARINAVYVLPDYRRKGIAGGLVKATIEWVRTKNCSRVRLNSSEEAQSLYQSLGFKPLREMEFTL